MIFNDYHLQDGKTMKILGMIIEPNLIIVPISTGTYFYLFFFLRIKKKKFFYAIIVCTFREYKRRNVVAQKMVSI